MLGVVEDQEILFVEDLARIFRVTADAIRKRFQKGEFPQRKLGGKWVMTRSQLRALIESAVHP